MKRNLLLGVACLMFLSAVAQQDPVLMRINNQEVHRSEFEYVYHKNKSLSGLKPMALNEYVELFVNFKLKVAAARSAGIDTTSAFCKELSGYRTQLAKAYLTDEEVEEACARQFYTKMKANSRAGQVQVLQLFKRLPQNTSTAHIRKAQAQMDSIYQVLCTNSQADFSAYVEKYSDDKKAFWTGWLQTPEEFENVAFSLQKGDYSKPFYSPQGLHIVKVIDRKEILPFEEMREEIVRRLMQQAGMNKGTEALLQKLKQQYGYALHSAGVDELLAKGETAQPLFTLDGRVYNGTEFKRFSIAHPLGIKTQLDAFITKTILDYEDGRLEQKYPEFCLLMQEYKEGMLLFEISNREVWEKSMTDEAGLKAYFKAHKSDYDWKQPRYKGAVLHCANKKTAKKARKLIKKLPEKEWTEAIRSKFNQTSEQLVEMQEGVFSAGENKYVDKLVFKKGDFTPLESYPFTVVIGEKQKGPDSYKEVGIPLSVSYQNHLDLLWIKRLRAAGKVEINQEVLKTVNNH